MLKKHLDIRCAAGRAVACVAAALAVAAATFPGVAQPIPYRPYVRTYNSTPVTHLSAYYTADLGSDARVPAFTLFDTPSIEGVARDIAYGSDKNHWINSDCTGTIVRIAPGGAQKAFVYKPNNNCYSSTPITPGIDHSMWLADKLAAYIARSGTTG